MKLFRVALLVLLSTVLCLAQQPIQAPDLSANSITFPVFTLNPVPVPGATITVVGTPGQATWYFWASANFQLGSIVSPLGSVGNAPNTLSGSNYVQIIPTQYPAGVTTVDILATTTPVSPTGACNCAVATGLTSGGTNFQSNSLSPYTVSFLNPRAFQLRLTNEVVGSGSTHLLLRNALTGALIADLSTATAGVTGSGTANFLPLWATSSTLGNSQLQQSTIGGGGGVLSGIGIPPGAAVNSITTEELNSSVTSGQASLCAYAASLTFPTGAFAPCYDLFLQFNSAGTLATGLTSGLMVQNTSTYAFNISLIASAIGSGSSNSEIRAIEADAQPSSSGISVNRAVAAWAGYGGGSGAITTNQSFYAKSANTNALGVITNNYGMFVDTPSNTGTLTNDYGIYVADQSQSATGGTNSNPHAIFTAGTAPSSFGGGLQQNGTALALYCGTTVACGNTATPLAHFAFGAAPLTSGTPSTAVITGISPAFTSTTSYQCWATNQTTQANPVKVVNTSTSSITITGPNTVSDSISYGCIGT